MSVGERIDEWTNVLYEQPGVTGIFLGVVIHLAQEFITSIPVGFAGVLLFAFGTVAGIWSDDWWAPAGRALSVAGAFVLLVQAVTTLV